VAPPASVTQPAEPKPAPVVKEAPAPAASKPVARPAKVSVKKGETLESIAKQWGTSPAAIMMENNLVKDTVKPGQSLKLPKR
jgi:LysM repeat protein